MNCQEYKGMIEDALDVSLNGELEAGVRRHLDHCPECRDYLASRRREHSAFFAGVNAAYSHLRQPPADLAERIVREVEARRNARRGWRRLSLPKWAIIAASVAAMAGFVFAAAAVVGGVGESEGTKATEGTAYGVADAAATGSSATSVAHVSSDPSNKLEANQKGETVMSKVKAAAAALTAAITTTPLASASGDEYQFIDPATYPAANVSYSARSSAITIDAGALRVAGAPADLEARSRTRGASSAIQIDATKWYGMVISVF